MAAKRYGFIDHYRGWAVLVMIETHAVNAWLSDSWRGMPWFGYLNHLNGLVAPSFIFIAGISFALIASRKFEAIRNITPEFLRLLRRFSWIWLLGYLLHLPRIRWQDGGPSVVTTDLAAFYQVDVLQTIALSLIVLLLLCVMLRRRTAWLAGVCAIAVAALLVTPWLWGIDFSRAVHPFVANYLNGRNNPLFPMFPWAVFCWAGAIAGSYFLFSAARQQEGRAIAVLLAAGVMLFAGGFLLRKEILFFPYGNFWLESPQWVMMRLGIVLGLFAMFWRMEARGLRGGTIAVLIGTESLVAYVVHLQAIYGVTGNKALLPFLGYRAYGIGATVLLYVCVLTLTTLVVWVWKRRRRASRTAAAVE